MSIISFNDFLKVNIFVGTIMSVVENNKLKNLSFVLQIDFGCEIGIKKSSAQLKANYNIESLVGKQIIAVINFAPKQIGNIISEVLVLGLPDSDDEPILVIPEKKIKNGKRIY
jgi:tRNA-binding protein